MIIWETVNYSLNQAKKDFDLLEVKSNEIIPIKLSNDYEELRRKLIEARDEVFDRHFFDVANKLDYKFDFTFGLKLYQILNEDIGFTNRVATNDDVWRYLSLHVIPDVVHSRWGMNEDHFYKISRRIWLKTIWWYIALSWQGDEESTLKILGGNSTDTILQLVERPGIGYHIELYRELMRQYGGVSDPTRNIFRQVLKLNTARLLTISPELIDGGIEAYVENLFEIVHAENNDSE